GSMSKLKVRQVGGGSIPQPVTHPAGAARLVTTAITARAERTPDALAVSDGSSSWTYDELEQRASAIARKLHSLGIGPDVPVGLCMKRSIDLGAAALGVLKSGGAYIAMDPENPPERSRFMLDDANAALVIADASLEPIFRETGICVLSLDEEQPDSLK